MNSEQLRRLRLHIVKDWDSYATMIVVVVVAFAGIIGVDVRFVISGTLFVLGLLAYSILRLRLHEEEGQRTFVFAHQSDAYEELKKYVQNTRVRKAILIQYSSNTATRLLEEPLARDALVTLYVQDEEIAEKNESGQQKQRIITTLADMESVFGSACKKPYNLQVSGVRLGERGTDR